MQKIHHLRQIYVGFRRLALPLRHNFLFVTFMYVLLALTMKLENLVDLHALYYTEFFFDLYILCAILYFLPPRYSRWMRGLFYFVGYSTSIVESFLYMRFYLRFMPISMQLFVETNPDEAKEFLSAYVKGPALVDTILIYGSVLALNIFLACYGRRIFLAFRRQVVAHTHLPLRMHPLSILLDILIPLLFSYSVYISWEEKVRMYNFFQQHTTIKAEKSSWLYFYTPFYRLLYSFKCLKISGQELEMLKHNMAHLEVDSCSYHCPNIVLIIGESYNKHHSELYGYPYPTTPYQKHFARHGSLAIFTDAVSPWNVTSNAFKSFLSTQSIDTGGAWSDGVLFPALFRKAGYKVAFITNQFNKSNRQSFADFNGSFFLNDPLLDSLCFDFRNARKTVYDRGVIDYYKRYVPTRHNLVIFHLYGQHQEYGQRFETSDTIFRPSSYRRPDLSTEEKQVVADYDNATRYNDEIITRIYSFFKNDDAIIIYMPDHGEEVYDEIHNFGRDHDADIVPAIARNEFEIPFTMWFTNKFRRRHPDIVHRAKSFVTRPFASDDLPHLMLGLAGISCKEYDATRDVLSDKYISTRPRMLKRTADYNQIMKKAPASWKKHPSTLR